MIKSYVAVSLTGTVDVTAKRMCQVGIFWGLTLVAVKTFWATATILSNHRDGGKARLQYNLVLTVKRGSIVFWENFGKFERPFLSHKASYKNTGDRTSNNCTTNLNRYTSLLLFGTDRIGWFLLHCGANIYLLHFSDKLIGWTVHRKHKTIKLAVTYVTVKCAWNNTNHWQMFSLAWQRYFRWTAGKVCSNVRNVLAARSSAYHRDGFPQ